MNKLSFAIEISLSVFKLGHATAIAANDAATDLPPVLGTLGF